MKIIIISNPEEVLSQNMGNKGLVQCWRESLENTRCCWINDSSNFCGKVRGLRYNLRYAQSVVLVWPSLSLTFTRPLLLPLWICVHLPHLNLQGYECLIPSWLSTFQNYVHFTFLFLMWNESFLIFIFGKFLWIVKRKRGLPHQTFHEICLQI